MADDDETGGGQLVIDIQRMIDDTTAPDPTLLDGGAWDRTHYRDQAKGRIDLRRDQLMMAKGIDSREFELACKLIDDPDLRARLATISTRQDLGAIRKAWRQIRDEELVEYDEWTQRCEHCGGDGKVPNRRFLGWCQACIDAYFSRPSTPPVNGISSALARARRAGLPATLTQEQWQRTVDHFDDRCALCGGPWCLVEHATSISLGGGTTASNCLPACTYCNVNKGSVMLEHMKNDRATMALVWLRQHGR